MRRFFSQLIEGFSNEAEYPDLTSFLTKYPDLTPFLILVVGFYLYKSLNQLKSDVRDMKAVVSRTNSPVLNGKQTNLVLIKDPLALGNIAKTAMKPSNLDVNGSNTASWIVTQGLALHKKLLDKGVVLITTHGLQNIPKNITPSGDSFELQNRVLKFSTGPNKQTKKVTALLARIGISEKPRLFIVNTQRRNEVYAPILLRQGLANYFHPWLSLNPNSNLNKSDFFRFDSFVTAGCMFGASLVGYNPMGKSCPLIKHDIQFYAEEKISRVSYNPKQGTPYEEAQFLAFESLIPFINKVKDPTKAIKLYYHLPYFDYILFGVQLYIENKITKDALHQLVAEVMKKKENYSKRLHTIVKSKDITLIIQSPFENLLGPLWENETNPSPEGFVEALSKLLGLNAPVNSKNQSNFLTNCTTRLQKNDFNKEHQMIWQFVLTKHKKISNLEKLLKLGNTLLIIAASKEKNPFSVCSIFPISEKQIQLEHQKLSKHEELKLPPVFNLTSMDSVISYDEQNQKGTLFYSTDNRYNIESLIKGGLFGEKKNLLHHANEQAAKQLITSDEKGNNFYKP